MSPRLPAIFFGHGNPMNALADNAWTQAWAGLGREWRAQTRAVLMVSAHWYLPGVRIGAQAQPRTVHDFGGFPGALFDVMYPAPGAPDLARRVAGLLAPTPVQLDTSWGLDHGTWSVLRHVFPQADVPVLQLSLDETLAPAQHYALARALAPLREDGVLIAGSGNLVHNLHAYAWGKTVTEPLDWAQRFEDRTRALMLAGDHAPLVDYPGLGPDAMLSAPTPEHYLPLLYVLAQQQAGEAVSFPVEGFDGGSISMLAVRIG